MLQRSSGGSYPAMTEDELAQILIPLPSLEIQNRVVTEVLNRREGVRRLRIEAETEWQAAKKHFEDQLLEKTSNLELKTLL